MGKLKKVAKIETLPKTVRDSIPFRGIMRNGVIETSPGTFTKTYRLPDTNFSIASQEEQLSIYNAFQTLINSFDAKMRWQFNIFNHATDKVATMQNLRVPPQKDGLNAFRQEMNKFTLSCMQIGNASTIQEKYLTVAVDDLNPEHASRVLNKQDVELKKQIREMTGSESESLSTKSRLELLYNIYNHDADYRFSDYFGENNEDVDLAHIHKLGLTPKDIIGPNGMDFAPASSFQLGDTYASALFLDVVPVTMTTDYLADLADIQCDMLISLTYEKLDSEAAIKIIRSKLASIDARASQVNKEHLQVGYIGGLPQELEANQNSAKELMVDVTQRNQSAFYITMIVVVFAATKETLEDNVRLVKSVAMKHRCPLKPLRHQQEFALNTALPLCRNDVFLENMFTTESASIFIPFNTQELNQKNSIFYGINQSSKSMIMCDRTTGDNFNGLIFGGPGSGKSFIAKCEMTFVLLKHTNAQVFVIDPQGEYQPLVNAFHGQEIKLAPGTQTYMNPFDLDLSEAEEEGTDVVANKVDYIITLIGIMADGKLNSSCETILDKCIRKIYRPYIEMLQREGITSKRSECPTLVALYQELLAMSRDSAEAKFMADVLYKYTMGSFSTFSKRTNVDTKARFIVYNIRSLGAGLHKLGLYICLNDIMNRIYQNSKRDIYTWFYIDEFHILLESEEITRFLRRIWKTVRKWLGVPTGIMQNTSDLLRDEDAKDIFNTTSFVIMMKNSQNDRQNLGYLLSLSDSQLACIENAKKGYGLLYNGKIIIPFGMDFPKDTMLYDIFTTQHDGNGSSKGGSHERVDVI